MIKLNCVLSKGGMTFPYSGMRAWYLRRKWIAIIFVCLVFGYLTMLSFVTVLGKSTDPLIGQYFNEVRGIRIVQPSSFKPEVRVQKRRVFSVNCAAILDGDAREVEKAKAFVNRTSADIKSMKDTEYIHLTKDCVQFFKTRDYLNYQVTQEEKEFSIAYSILFYKEVEQAERLLHAIYSPNNLYCLHVDMFSDQRVHDAARGIADCLSNVFIVSRQEYVVYAGFTRLQADLNCMQDLLRRGKSWKYFINLPSQQFPIKTNLEIIRILQTYNGANDIEGITGKRRIEGRFRNRFIYKNENVRKKPRLLNTNQKKDDPPHNAAVVKGSAYGIFSRKFVEFVTNNNTARDLLDWFRDVYSPDEYYWATLHHNYHLNVPGAFYKGVPDKKPWLAVYANWGEYKCFGKFVRGVCVFGVGDLRRVTRRNELFVNKFFLDFQPLALDCMEEWYLNQTALGSPQLNMTFYRSLPFIGNSAIKTVQ